MKTEKPRRALILPDIHAGYHDPITIDNVLEFAHDYKADDIIQLGDFVDFYGISRFDKNPNRVDTVQEELDVMYDLWSQLKESNPKARCVQLAGNHEDRLHTTLLHNPGLYSLSALKPRNLFRLDELGIEWVPSDKTFKLNSKFVVTHGANDGCKMSPHSAYSAKANLDKWGVSGISGHTHRFGSHYKTLAEEVLCWHEIGCLASLKPEYVKNPNWQQGFATVEYTKNRFHVSPVVITNHQFIANGRKYG